MKKSKNVVWFKDISDKDLGMVGGKGLNLGIMYNIPLPIPPGFVVTAQAYKKFLDNTGIKERIMDILKDTDVDNNEELQNASRTIKEIILDAKMHSNIVNDIVDAYDNLNVNDDIIKSLNIDTINMIKAGRDLPFVAVRSSATAEDRPEASFAGQQETFLNVKGVEKVIKAVQKCWASLFTARAIYYREKNNFSHEDVLIAVVVQKMVDSVTSGVMFSINPATNNRDEVMIESAFGLGEVVVGGKITPDTYIVDKNKLEIKSKKIAVQPYALLRNERGGNIEKKLTKEEGGEQKIDDSIIIKLADYGKKIEEYYGVPQDIEWATEKNRIYIVQSRTVTTLMKQREDAAKISVDLKPILEGLSASPGVAEGRVKIVSDVSELGKIMKGDILVAIMTSPDYVPAMKRAGAIVCDEGGITAHAAIVSRELGIPCIVGTEKATKILKENELITIDGSNGRVYKGDVGIEHEETEIVDVSGIETITKVKVNCDIPSQSERAASTGADGIGLFRIEFVIAENRIHPAKYIRDGKSDEYSEMLYEGMKETVENFKDKPVWIRTSDIRTDEYGNLEGGNEEPHEDNPMLGWHGIRRSLDDQEILRAEFKAIKRLHDEGFSNIGVMIPFVISVDEVRKAKKIMEDVGLKPLDDIEFGVMCETPASVWIMDDLCREGISFVSFGTNDLTQTTLGVDRNNEKLQNLYDELHPAVLRSIEHVINICKKYDVTTSICGQAGSNPEMVEKLVKFGIESISANIDAVGLVKNTVSKIEKRMLLDAARKNL